MLNQETDGRIPLVINGRRGTTLPYHQRVVSVLITIVTIAGSGRRSSRRVTICAEFRGAVTDTLTNRVGSATQFIGWRPLVRIQFAQASEAVVR